MEFISAEEFLKQPEKVQKVLLDWWEPEIGDLYTFSGKDINNDKQAWAVGSELEADICRKAKGIKIPLLAEGQLRKFIENKCEGRVGSEYCLNGYTIYLWGELTTENDANSIIDYWETSRIDLISSYWDVACEIAADEDVTTEESDHDVIGPNDIAP